MKDNQKVWIKGDKNRGAEVIETLETLGGINKSCLEGNFSSQIYFIAHDSTICLTDESSELAMFVKKDYQELTLPEEWKEGDIIISKDMQNYCVVATTFTSDSDVVVTLSLDRDGEYDYMKGGVAYIKKDNYRQATADEIALFHELLHYKHKDWDSKENRLIDWRWTPENEELYYYVDSTGEVMGAVFYDICKDDVRRVKLRNCFKAKYEALLKASEIKDIFAKD